MIRPRFILILSLLTSIGCEDPAQQAKSTSQPADTPENLVAVEALETAQLYLDASQFDHAEAIAIAAQMSAPDDGDIHELLARIDFGRGMAQRTDGLIDASNATLAQALDHWWEACARSPQSGPMHVSAGDVASMLGRHEAARHFYGKALEIDGDGGRAALCMAQLLMAEDAHRARALLQSVTDAGAVPEAHASLALLLARDGDAPGAREQLGRAVAIAPHAVSVRVMQARVERLLGDPSRGIEVLSGLDDDAEGDQTVAWERAACWTALGRHRRAADAWVVCFHANAHRTDAGAIALQAAEAWEAAGDAQGAAVWHRQARLLGVTQSSSSSSSSP